MRLAVLVVAILVLAIVAYGDVQTRRIPNSFCLAVAILGLARIIIARDGLAALYTMAAGAAIFIAVLVLFWRGAIGGGDAKLVAAMALLIGYRELPGFLLLMSLCGGALAVATLARDRFGPRMMAPQAGPGTAATPRGSTVPYGVAVAAAGVITLIIAG